MNSKMVLLSVGVILLLGGALVGYLYGVDSTPTKTTTAVSITTTMLTSTFTQPSTSLDAYEQVSNSFASHMLFISERNAFAIVSQYEENATVTWMDGLCPEPAGPAVTPRISRVCLYPPHRAMRRHPRSE